MMDNCLASNSETGGVGCDNMTMAVVGILNGQTKEEWYEKIAQRVANGDGPCAPPEYGTRSFIPYFSFSAKSFFAAEFRGPGVHHNFDDSDSGYDMDMNRSSNVISGGRKGRIILLGDGSEILTGSEDTDMADNDDSATGEKKVDGVPKDDGIPEKLNETIRAAKEKLEQTMQSSSEHKRESKTEEKSEPKSEQ